MQVKLHLLAVAVILLLAIIMAQAYESQYDSSRLEARREFLRRLLKTIEDPEEMDRR